jgi:hypothetical protein
MDRRRLPDNIPLIQPAALKKHQAARQRQESVLRKKQELRDAEIKMQRLLLEWRPETGPIVVPVAEFSVLLQDLLCIGYCVVMDDNEMLRISFAE